LTLNGGGLHHRHKIFIPGNHEFLLEDPRQRSAITNATLLVDEDGDRSIVVTELHSRLPCGDIKTCGAFMHLNAGFCATCHKYRPHYSMSLIELPDGSKGWVCDGIVQAIHPERYAEGMKRFAQRMEQFRNSPEGNRWRETFGGDGYLEN
jgi:hypothetical protein